ncbi:MAG: TIGR00725 family protein [Anaerolineae bacterium]
MLAIGVIGSGCCDLQAYRAAEEVGRLLAEAGAVVVCGGLGGVMEAACRGAKLAGGRTLGILPGTDAAQANPYVDIPIVTGMGEARNQILVRTSRALIAVGGEYGTLSEIAFALKFGRPVVGLRTWQLARGGMPVQAIAEAETPQEAVRLALELARERGA